MNATQHNRVVRARMSLLLDQPWFGTLSLNLRLEESACGTAATDGTMLWYDPTFVQGLSDRELVGLVAHEVMHCALLHMYRRGHRDPEQWNIAADLVINGALVKAGFELPEGAYLDAQYDGLPAEVVYAQRQQAGNPPPPTKDGKPGKDIGSVVDPQPAGQPGGQPGSQPGQGPGQPGAGQPQPGGNTETDWQIATEQASAIARAAGQLPGDQAKAAKEARQTPADWITLTREFVEHLTPHDTSWAVPNRRFIGRGLYLPGVYKENLGRAKVIIDTSDSIYRAVGVFATEIKALMEECRPESIEVIYADARVKNTQTFDADDFSIDAMQAKGGGGTLFNPAFDYIAKQDEEPTFAIYFTDLDNGGEKVRDPGYPVLWVTGKNVTRKQPFGQLAVIDVDM